ncbi:hypothetical protein [Halocola ammonii]
MKYLIVLIVFIGVSGCGQSRNSEPNNEKNVEDDSSCRKGLQNAKREISKGNLIYVYYNSVKERFPRVLLDEFGILARHSTKNEENDCFKIIMDQVIECRYGKNFLSRANTIADSLNKELPLYLNADSTYYYLPKKNRPVFADGKGDLDNFTRIYSDTIDSTMAGYVVLDFVIDTLGRIQAPRLISKLSPEMNRDALQRLSEMPRWRPAFINVKQGDEEEIRKVPFKKKVSFYYAPTEWKDVKFPEVIYNKAIE